MKAVIFDLDGTLLNTLTDLTNAVNFALSAHSLPERSEKQIAAATGDGVKFLVRRSVPEGTPDEIYQSCFLYFKERYNAHLNDNTAPYPGAVECIKKLRAEGLKIAVVSNKLHEAVLELCEIHFPGMVDFAAGIANDSEKKPSPVNSLRALSSFGIEKADAIYVGDSEVDLQTAKNAGLNCISVSWGFRTKEDLLARGAKVIADSFEEVASLIMAVS